MTWSGLKKMSILAWFIQLLVIAMEALGNPPLDCTKLLMGQYLCDPPDIDPDTQQARGCTKESPYVMVKCRPAPGIRCEYKGQNSTSGFEKAVPCEWTNGYSFQTALLLSIFLGMFGIDRFYLGYPAIGLLKFCTFGFMFLGQLIDIILIAAQVVGPSDGSHYVIDFYGAGLKSIGQNTDTYFKPQQF